MQEQGTCIYEQISGNVSKVHYQVWRKSGRFTIQGKQSKETVAEKSSTASVFAEIVFAEDLSTGTFAEQFIDAPKDESSETDEVEEDVPVKPTQESQSVDLFRAALVLRNTIKDVP